jgi:hypothetical protein
VITAVPNRAGGDIAIEGGEGCIVVHRQSQQVHVGGLLMSDIYRSIYQAGIKKRNVLGYELVLPKWVQTFKHFCCLSEGNRVG